MKEAIFLSLRREYALKGFIGKHPSFIHLIEKLEMLADKDVSILLVGETGTGKGRCAEFMHQYGNLHNCPFIPYNCGAGPESLFESQIFGHIRGAFTGAHKDRIGLVEEAHMGILFLDEINSLSRSSQVKLNHFLEIGCFRRIGENRIRKADVRIIAASNMDLLKEVKDGRFRQDLYYRLAEYELPLPALRERQEDIILLAKYFLEKHKDLCRKRVCTFSADTLKQLIVYPWPGNIRELENFMKRCLIDATSNQIDTIKLPATNYESSGDQFDDFESLAWREAKKKIVSQFERIYLQNILEKYHGIVATCAKHAGIQPSDFWKLMRKYSLKAQPFRLKDIR